jgi:hypothetical protein
MRVTFIMTAMVIAQARVGGFLLLTVETVETVDKAVAKYGEGILKV